MALQKGDFILINYTAKVKETNEVFDTTVEETAKKEHLQERRRNLRAQTRRHRRRLGPQSLRRQPSRQWSRAIRQPWRFRPRKPSDQETQKKSSKFTSRKSPKKASTPQLGMRIEYGGKNAIIRSIGAGRALSGL